MSTTARALLNIMSVRLSMLESGVTKPHSVVAEATRQLVKRLSLLTPDEVIQVTYTESPLHVQYIQQSSGEVLAEWRQPDDT